LLSSLIKKIKKKLRNKKNINCIELGIFIFVKSRKDFKMKKNAQFIVLMLVMLLCQDEISAQKKSELIYIDATKLPRNELSGDYADLHPGHRFDVEPSIETSYDGRRSVDSGDSGLPKSRRESLNPEIERLRLKVRSSEDLLLKDDADLASARRENSKLIVENQRLKDQEKAILSVIEKIKKDYEDIEADIVWLHSKREVIRKVLELDEKHSLFSKAGLNDGQKNALGSDWEEFCIRMYNIKQKGQTLITFLKSLQMTNSVMRFIYNFVTKIVNEKLQEERSLNLPLEINPKLTLLRTSSKSRKK